jgi:16S rRNA (cytidine1402-2'-O)-methyltransferase
LLGLPHKTLIACHDHNEAHAAKGLIDRILGGQAIALVSDAGAPLISDPGYNLVDAAHAHNVMVTAIPGPSAVIAALQLSGLPSDRFLFAGFLPAKTTARKQTLRELSTVPASLIFFESPNRLAASLADMAEMLGDRPAAVVRELTKLYEEAVRGTLSSLAARYDGQTVKGEIVVVIGPPQEEAPATGDSLDDRIKAALAQGLGVRDAASLVAAETGHPRRQVYARALVLGKP